MAKVFRLETDEGAGVYQGGLYVDVCGRDSNATDRQPLPPSRLSSFDCDCCNPWHLVYGFISLEQLCAWFDEHELGALRRDGRIALSVYDVPDDSVEHDAFQATFHRCRAQLVERAEIPQEATANV